MANEEERAKILAEYAAMDDNEEDDCEFEDEDDDDSGVDDYDDDDDSNDYNDDVEEEEDPNSIAILTGALGIDNDSDSGNLYRIIYSGTWKMKNCPPNVPGKKFKLKSKLLKRKKKKTDGIEEKFNFLLNPTTNKTILFDGFFWTAEDVSRKIKERDVEIMFTNKEDAQDSTTVLNQEHVLSKESSTSSSTVPYVESNGNNEKEMNGFLGSKESIKKVFPVLKFSGKGVNEFGSFILIGEYSPEDTNKHKLDCTKKYPELIAASSANRRSGRSKRLRDDDSEDDDGIISESEDVGADYNELIALHDEANMSVEELRKRYYSNNTASEVEVKCHGRPTENDDQQEAPQKKQKPSINNDSDDEYGF